jgi:hypothetical protein
MLVEMEEKENMVARVRVFRLAYCAELSRRLKLVVSLLV